MIDQRDTKPRRRRRTGTDRWRTHLAIARLIVLIIATVGRFMQ